MYHGLHSSVSPVLTATGPVNGCLAGEPLDYCDNVSRSVSVYLRQRGFAADVFSNVRLVKHDDRHRVNMTTLGRRLCRHAKTLAKHASHCQLENKMLLQFNYMFFVELGAATLRYNRSTRVISSHLASCFILLCCQIPTLLCQWC